jgi:hypothetical protein
MGYAPAQSRDLNAVESRNASRLPCKQTKLVVKLSTIGLHEDPFSGSPVLIDVYMAGWREVTVEIGLALLMP